MTSWKPIEDAPKDGRPVLLWARLKSAPAEKDAASYPIVGRWDNWQWQATPDLLSSAVLIPTYWTALPPEPDMCLMVVERAAARRLQNRLGIVRSVNELESGNVG